LPPNPAAPLTELEQEQASLVESSVQDAVDTGVAQFISGTRPISDWDNFVTQIRNLGADQIAELQNAAYQRNQ